MALTLQVREEQDSEANRRQILELWSEYTDSDLGVPIELLDAPVVSNCAVPFLEGGLALSMYEESTQDKPGHGRICIDECLFRKERAYSLWVLHHECIHLHLHAGPLSAAHRSTKDTSNKINDAMLHAGCPGAIAALCRHLARWVDEIGAEKYGARHNPSRFVFRAPYYLAALPDATDVMRRPGAPYVAFSELVRVGLGLCIAPDPEARAAIGSLRECAEALLLRVADSDLAVFLLDQARRWLAIDPDRDDPHPYDEVCLKLVEPYTIDRIPLQIPPGTETPGTDTRLPL